MLSKGLAIGFTFMAGACSSDVMQSRWFFQIRKANTKKKQQTFGDVVVKDVFRTWEFLGFLGIRGSEYRFQWWWHGLQGSKRIGILEGCCGHCNM